MFLLDEVELLGELTDRQSTNKIYHMLLTQLAVPQSPVCIATGTDNGDILKISEMSMMVPIVLSLTPLTYNYRQNWQEMTDYLNEKDGLSIIVDEQNDKVMQALVQASYKIPRLLFFAHQAWYAHKSDPTRNKVFPLQGFEAMAKRYYREMFAVLSSYSNQELSHIIFACGVRWEVNEDGSCIPGTNLKWTELIKSAIVFPDGHNGFIFPFGLVWSDVNKESDRKSEVLEFSSSLIKNIDVKQLFWTHDQISSYGQTVAGKQFESAIACSLAVRYYLLRTNKKSPITLRDLFGSLVGAYSDFNVNLSQGIYYPVRNEAFASDKDLPPAVIHNKKISNAHHDLIVPTDSGNVAISVKASTEMAKPGEVIKQTKVRKGSEEEARLIWMYLGESDERHQQVPVLNGYSVCNRHSIDTLIFWKKLDKENKTPT